MSDGETDGENKRDKEKHGECVRVLNYRIGGEKVVLEMKGMSGALDPAFHALLDNIRDLKAILGRTKRQIGR